MTVVKETGLYLVLLLVVSEAFLGLPTSLFIRSAITEHLQYLKYGDIFWIDSMWRSIIGASFTGMLMLVILAIYIYMIVSVKEK